MPDELRVEAARLAPGWDTPAGREFCARLPALTAALPASAVIHRDRNTLWRCPGPTGEVVVKRFRLRPGRMARLAAVLRASKAVRSYDTARRLLALGFATPVPLAAVEVRRRRRLVDAYYVCAWLDHAGTARDLRRGTLADGDRHLPGLGAWVARLHGAGIFQRDLNGGNILLTGDPQGPLTPALVDLNRVRFGRVGIGRGLANLHLLGFAGERAARLLDAYLAARRPRLLGPRAARALFAWHGLVHRLWWRIKGLSRPARRKLGL